MQDDSNPIFNAEFAVNIPYNSTTGTFSKVIFELWDSNTISKDAKVFYPTHNNIITSKLV